jgi:hypothetical protein
MLKERLEQIFAVVSVFFYSILENKYIEQTSRQRILNAVLNLIYSIAISLPIGIIIQLILYLGISTLTGFEARENFLLIIPLFLFICLSGIIILNCQDYSFSLPRNILNFYITLKIIKPAAGIWKPIIFVFTITVALILTQAWFLSSFRIPEQYQTETIFFIIIIALFLSMILYSEATKEQLIRIKRQFIFSMLTFLAFFALNIYQMIIYINTTPSNETITIISTAILGLVLSMTTAIDKTRCFYETVQISKNKEINEMWNTFYEKYSKYSYKMILQLVNNKKGEINKSFKIIQIIWLITDRKEKVKTIILLILVEAFIVFLWLNQKEIDHVLIKYIKDLVTRLFDGNEEVASISLGAITIIGIMIWLINDAKNKFGNSNLKYKIQFIYRMEFIIIILLISINALFPIKFIKFIILPLSITFILTVFITSTYLKLKDVGEEQD